MNWYELSMNAKAVTSLFVHLPNLDDIAVARIELERARGCLRLGFDLGIFPDRPPVKWAQERYNRAQLTVDFFDIMELDIKGWGGDNQAKLSIADAEGQLTVVIKGDECSVRFACLTFRIERVSGYWDPG